MLLVVVSTPAWAQKSQITDPRSVAFVHDVGDVIGVVRETWGEFGEAEHALFRIALADADAPGKRAAIADIRSGLGPTLMLPRPIGLKLQALNPAQCVAPDQPECLLFFNSAVAQVNALIVRQDYLQQWFEKDLETIRMEAAAVVSLDLGRDFAAATHSYYAGLDQLPGRASAGDAVQQLQGAIYRYWDELARIFSAAPVLNCGFARDSLAALDPMADAIASAARAARRAMVDIQAAAAQPAWSDLQGAQISALIKHGDDLRFWRARLREAFRGTPCRFQPVIDAAAFHDEMRAQHTAVARARIAKNEAVREGLR